MCRKMKSIAVLLNLLHYFYHWIQCDKNRNFVHGEAFEVLHEMYRFMRGVLKTHKINCDCSISIKFPQDVTTAIFLTIV